jgi:hypothetical protein
VLRVRLAPGVDGELTFDALPPAFAGHVNVDKIVMVAVAGEVHTGRSWRLLNGCGEREPRRPRRQVRDRGERICHGQYPPPVNAALGAPLVTDDGAYLNKGGCPTFSGSKVTVHARTYRQTDPAAFPTLLYTQTSTWTGAKFTRRAAKITDAPDDLSTYPGCD